MKERDHRMQEKESPRTQINKIFTKKQKDQRKFTRKQYKTI